MAAETDHPTLKIATSGDVAFLNQLIDEASAGPKQPTKSNAHDFNYFVAFDGTGNNKDNADLAPTNVEKLWDLVAAAESERRYYSGPGTKGNALTNQLDTLFGYSMDDTAEAAYKDLVGWAQTQFKNDPLTNLRLTGVSFSRGGGTHTAFLNMLQKNGIPNTSTAIIEKDVTEHDVVVGYKEYFVKPGTLDLGSHVMYDRVVAGGRGDALVTLLPANADMDILSITSRDENRYVFALDSLLNPNSRDPRVEEYTVAGVHSDVGGGYWDSGISNYTLKAAYEWLKSAGTPMKDYASLPTLLRSGSPARPVSFTFNPAPIIHDSFEGTFGYDGEERESGAWVPNRANNINYYASPVVSPVGSAALSAALAVLGLDNLPADAIAALDYLKGLSGTLTAENAAAAATQLLTKAGAQISDELVNNVAGQLVGQNLATAKLWTDGSGIVNLQMGETLLGVTKDGSAIKTLLDSSSGKDVLTSTVFANGGQAVQSIQQAFTGAGIGEDIIQKQFLDGGAYSQIITKPSGAFTSGFFSGDGFGFSSDYDDDGHVEHSETTNADGSTSTYDATYSGGVIQTSSQVNKDPAGHVTYSDVLSADATRVVKWFDYSGSDISSSSEYRYNARSDEEYSQQTSSDGSKYERKSTYYPAPSRQLQEESYVSTNGSGHVDFQTLRKFDANGHQLYQKSVSSDGSYDVEVYTYSGDQRLSADIKHYDIKNQLLTSRVDATDGSSITLSYSYTDAGKILTSEEHRYNTRTDEEYYKQLSADGGTDERKSIYYPAPSRQLQEESYVRKDGVGHVEFSTLRRYDATGHQLYQKAVSSDGSYDVEVYTYSGDQRLSADVKHYDIKNQLLTSRVDATDGSSITLSYSYTDAGKILTSEEHRYNTRTDEEYYKQLSADGGTDERKSTYYPAPSRQLQEESYVRKDGVGHVEFSTLRRYDATGHQLYQKTVSSDGSYDVEVYTYSGDQRLTSDIKHYDIKNQLLTSRVEAADGSSVALDYTYTGAGAVLTSSERKLDARGNETYLRQLDNLGVVETRYTSYTSAGQQVAVSNDTHNALGALTQASVHLAPDILPGNVTVSRDGNDLVVKVSTSANTVRITGFIQSDVPYAGTNELIVFDKDASFWTPAQVSTKLLQASINADKITGFSSADTISGLQGNDTLIGLGGNDQLDGGEGADSLDGGAGNDVLIGGNGDDRYVFGRGYNQDTITEAAGLTGGTDTIELASGIAKTDVTVTRDATSVTFKLNTGETIKSGWSSSTGYAVERLEFSDKSAWVAADFDAKVATPNNAPTGAVTITGTATQGQTLTASNTLADADGLGTITYQWLRNGAATGSTGATYVLTQADVGKQISAKAVYTDALGTAEAVTSAATAAVANVNDAPTGAVTITGTATQGQTLTASNTLADADGLGTVTYQWLRNGAATGSTGATYVLTQADVGKQISAKAVYTDALGAAEAVTSAATAAVANVNDAPTGTVTITGTATQGQTLTASNTLADADGLGTITYQWLRNGAATGSTGATYVLTSADVGAKISAKAVYTDLLGTAEAVTSATTAAVAALPANNAPTGAVTITGTATQGQTLTASNNLADADGLGTITYQWLRNGTAIGATGATYVLTQADVGKQISAKAVYTDALGTAEAVTSAATAAVANVNDAPTGTVTITGTVTQGQTLTASNTLADADGLGTVTYQWLRNGAATGSTGATYVLTSADVGAKISAKAVYTDLLGTAEAVTSATTAAVAALPANNAPTGAVTITGTATQGQTLTASNNLADADGLGTITYQWLRNGAATGSTGATYVLTQADVGKQISAKAVYTDAKGTAEAVTSAATAAVANVNDAPTGAVTITGTATQGQTLTASNNLADADGLGTITYQWLRNGAATGSTGATYVLTSADVRAQISAKAVYTDLLGTAEAVTSATTAAVAALPANNAPTGAVTITGTATQGQTLTASNNLADADGLGTITYQWLRNGAATGSTGATYVLTQADVGKQISAKAVYTDAKGTAEAVTCAATAAVANVNDAPTGAVTITGTATQGQTLTASNTLADADGLGAITYQWLRNGAATGSTGATYVLTQADVGKQISAKAVYTDALGTAEGVTSAATAAVANVNDAPTGAVTLTGTPTQGQTLTASNTLADADGLGAITYQWLSNGAAIGATGATGSTYVLTQADVGKQISVKAVYIDGFRTTETVTSAATAAVANVNDAPNGAVTITGTATQGQTLTASNTLADADGLGTITYQWLRNGTATGATGSTYALAALDVDQQITVSARYTDQLGTSESVTSAPTPVIAYANVSLTGGAGNDSLLASRGKDTLQGMAGNDTLDGGADIDLLVGGDGNDFYYVDATYDANTGNLVGMDTVTEGNTSTSGIDTISTSIDNYVLPANVENLVMSGKGAPNHGTGNELSNRISGGAVNDAIQGMAGDDTLLGAGGNDTLSGGDGVDSLDGGSGDDVLQGDAGNDILNGGAGNDILDGGLGIDSMTGGDGNDIYYVNDTTDAQNNVTQDLVVEGNTTSSGIDTVYYTQSGGIYTLTDNVENLVMSGKEGTGNALNNTITGANGINILSGLGGDDTILGMGGADTLFGDDGNDFLDGGAADDYIEGNAGNDLLLGGEGADSLYGGAGNDMLSDTSTTSNDTYGWGLGDGLDTLSDAGGTDQLQILGTLTADKIWLRHVGNNLELSVIGTGDALTINNWYTNPANQVETFTLANGKSLQAGNVQKLVDAMAGFTPPASGQTTLPANYQTALTPVITANWA